MRKFVVCENDVYVPLDTVQRACFPSNGGNIPTSGVVTLDNGEELPIRKSNWTTATATVIPASPGFQVLIFYEDDDDVVGREDVIAWWEDSSGWLRPVTANRPYGHTPYEWYYILQPSGQIVCPAAGESFWSIDDARADDREKTAQEAERRARHAAAAEASPR